MSYTSPFTEALRADREALNARFRLARAQRPGLDPAAALEALDTCARPVVNAVGSAHASAVLAALADVVLDAVGRGLLGPAAPGVSEAWADVLTAVPRLVEADAARLGRAVLRALRTLVGAGCDASRWAQRLAAVAPLAADTDALLGAGAVLAWTEGLAAYRPAALDALDRLDAGLAAAALGLAAPDALSETLARLRSNPWARPGDAPAETLHVVALCGDFVGFGGPFTSPPRVSVADGRLIADEWTARWLVFGDAFGTAVRRAPAGLLADAPPADAPFEIDPGGTVYHRGVRQAFPELAGWETAAATDHTLAVTLADSHRIVLVGLSAAPPDARPWRRA